MNIQDIIAKKRDRQTLTKEEIQYFITNYTNGTIPDYQAAALVMAIYLNGMEEEEITNLSLAMAYSGDVLNLEELGIVVDKHSTGGIGDKVTLILAPIIASLGVPVAKMSGRGLGYTGGTIDKLEAIEGYQTNVEIESFINQVKQIQIAVIGQTLNLAPADKKLYALRDCIAATASIPLIASSIMSKKIAAGANKIVLDVTCGSGAFMKDIDSAKQLAKMMKTIGNLAKKETICIITNMDEPLGKTVGNSLEVIEAIEFLKGNMQEDVKQVVFTLGAYMLKLAGKGEDIEENKQKIEMQIKNGKAFAKCKQWIEKQGGNSNSLEELEKWQKAKYIVAVKAEKEGYITNLDAQEVGKISMRLGAGRTKKEDSIDPLVGIVLEKKIGSYVKTDEVLAYIHANNEQKAIEESYHLKQIYKIGQNKISKQNIIDII